MSELEYCAFCDGGYAHSGICDKCATEIEQTGKELADKDRQLAEARAEIESLKLSAGELNGAFNARPKCEKCKDKDKLIEQMREALKTIDAIGSEKGDASRDDALRCFSIARAALAAERAEP